MRVRQGADRDRGARGSRGIEDIAPLKGIRTAHVYGLASGIALAIAGAAGVMIGMKWLPLMYMDDAIEAIMELMEADASRITVRTSYNVSAVSFTAGELAAEVAGRVEGFTCDFEPDFRQPIADSWPDSMDDSVARRDWGWKPEFDLPALVDTMLKGVREKLARD